MISCIVAKTKVLKVSQNVKNIKFDKKVVKLSVRISCLHQWGSLSKCHQWARYHPQDQDRQVRNWDWSKHTVGDFILALSRLGRRSSSGDLVWFSPTLTVSRKLMTQESRLPREVRFQHSVITILYFYFLWYKGQKKGTTPTVKMKPQHRWTSTIQNMINF